MEDPPYIRNLDGEAIYIRGDVFVEQCANGTACFLCSKSRSDAESEFDREHVIPQWLLRVAGLHRSTMTMPNAQKINYSRLTIPCCKRCNRRLAREFEDPISKSRQKSLLHLAKLFANNDFELPHKWSAFILLKLAIHDFRWKRDVSKQGSPMLGSFYDWNEIHHLSCLARTAISRFQIDPDAIGSILITSQEDSEFDLMTNMNPLSLMIRLDGLCLVSVPCDGTYAAKLHRDLIRRLAGRRLSGFEQMELFCRYTSAASLLKSGLVFETTADGIIRLCDRVPFEFRPDKAELKRAYGKLLDYHLKMRGLYDGIDGLQEITVLKGEHTFFGNELRPFLPTS
jgi:hypothetical protein